MAKFKVGDKVTDGNAVYEITDVDDGIYEWHVVSGRADRSHSKGGVVTWADNEMRLANSRACNGVRSRNAVVAKAINAQRAARNALTPYGAIQGLCAAHDIDTDDRGNGVFIAKATPEKIKSLVKTGPYSVYPFEVVPFGRGWSKVTASTHLANACGTARNGHFFCDERDYPSVAAVKKEYPGQIVKRVTGGWMVFDTATDYDTWKAQK